MSWEGTDGRTSGYILVKQVITATRATSCRNPPDPDVPDSGIRLLGTVDLLRARCAVHNLGLRQRIVLEESGKPLPLDTTSLRAAA